jgi:hypothetical protein
LPEPVASPPPPGGAEAVGEQLAIANAINPVSKPPTSTRSANLFIVAESSYVLNECTRLTAGAAHKLLGFPTRIALR